jgi:2-octaprenyl-6-methoxyphenol hydroxylase
MSAPIYDALIVGGGPIGCAAAIALSEGGLDVAVLEASDDARRAPDSRTLALSWNSRLILQRLGAWSDHLPATAIKTIHVSHRGHFGSAVLRAADLRLPALGYVLRFSDTHDALREATRAHRIQFHNGFNVTDVHPGSPVSEVCAMTPQGEQSLQARLIVIADGGAALARQFAQRVRQHDYGQVAVVGLVRPDRPHQNCAYERFSPTGPVALLPSAQQFAFVWTCEPQYAQVLVSLDDADFLMRFRDAFGDRAGRFVETGSRSAFPLVLRVVQQRSQAGVVLLGNASQTLHPIAGQGFNLGLRDAWELATLIGEMPRSALGTITMTSRFSGQRRADRLGGIAFTHGLALLFSNDFSPVAIGRGVGVAMMDNCPPLKRELMHRMIFGSRI